MFLRKVFWKYAANFQNTFSYEHLWTAAFWMFENYLAFLWSAISVKNVCNQLYLEIVYVKKTSQLQTSESSSSVSWDDFNFRLHETFRSCLQG